MKKVIKQTQGHHKMMRYIEDLIRNEPFLKKLRRLEKLRNRTESPQGRYQEWTPEQRKEHDRINDELESLVDAYEILRKRCNRLFNDPILNMQGDIAEEYGLNFILQDLALSMLRNKKDYAHLFWDETEMCKIMDFYDDLLNPANPCEEIIHLNPRMQMDVMTYPVSVSVHRRASKRDVLDFIEKKWLWIEGALRFSEEQKALRMRRRKHDQKLVDFLWQNRSFPAQQLKQKIDRMFPENGLVYYEISNIIKVERKRRKKNLNVVR